MIFRVLRTLFWQFNIFKHFSFLISFYEDNVRPSHLVNDTQADGLSTTNGAHPQAFYFSSLFGFICYHAYLK